MLNVYVSGLSSDSLLQEGSALQLTELLRMMAADNSSYSKIVGHEPVVRIVGENVESKISHITPNCYNAQLILV